MRQFRTLYGSNPLHLLTMVISLALAAYTISQLGIGVLWDTDVWWQSIAVWFLGAAVVHDLVLFPAYAGLDRLLLRRTHSLGRHLGRPEVPAVNHVRVPLLASALTFLLFFPGIIEQGTGSYLRATGQTQDPFLARWLLLVAGFFAISALSYALRLMLSARQQPPTA